jgi:hypothetical protein
MELTVPHEEGMRAANIRKLARYDALLQQIKDNLTGWEVNLHCMEIGTRGLIGNTMLETLTILKVPKKDNIQHQKNLKQIAAQSTQHIFRARHAHWWTEPNMSNDREEPMTVLQIAGTQPTTTATTSSNTRRKQSHYHTNTKYNHNHYHKRHHKHQHHINTNQYHFHHHQHHSRTGTRKCTNRMAQREMQRTRLPAYQQHARKRRLPCPHETSSYTDIKTGLPNTIMYQNG